MSLKIQFGSGGNILPGWFNTDLGWDDPTAKVDITKTLPWHDGVVGECLAEHISEHCAIGDCYRFFCEVRRILAPRGIFHVICPVVGPHLPHELAVDLLTGHGHMIALNEDLMRTMLWAAGFELNQIRRVDWCLLYGHRREIGEARDSLESCRLVATKT